MFVLGKFKDGYWSECEPMRNKAKVAENLVSSTVQYRVYTNRGDSQAGILAQA